VAATLGHQLLRSTAAGAGAAIGGVAAAAHVEALSLDSLDVAAATPQTPPWKAMV
jgi:hypothetical protein